MGIVATGKETLFDSNDSPVAMLSQDRCSLPADAAGNVTTYSGAVSTLSVLISGIDDSANWSVAVAASGLTGSLSGKTFTVASMTSDSCYVDFTAKRPGYADLTKRFHVAKVRQGASGDPGPGGQDAPRCRGLFPYLTAPAGPIVGDLVVWYSATQAYRGIYSYSGSDWLRLASPTPDQVSRCFLYILDAVRQGYGTSSDYAAGSASFEAIIANFLFVSQAVLAATGWLKSANYAESGGVPTAGFMLDALNQVIKAYGAVFVNASISGTLTSGGAFKGDRIKIENTKVTMWSGSSETSPAIGDQKIVLDTSGMAFISFYDCISTGSWHLLARFSGIDLSWGDHSLRFQSTGSIVDFSESATKAAYLLRASTNTSCIGEMFWSSSGAALPSRGTWLAVRAYSGNDMTIAAGGTAPYTNYQAIRV